MEELGSSVPPAQLRALLIIDAAGSMNLSRLSAGLGTSASAASRLCDRMQAAGLLTRDRAASSRREIVLVPTESGRQLAAWVAARRRDALGTVLAALTPDGKESLLRALRELAPGAAEPSGRQPQPETSSSRAIALPAGSTPRPPAGSGPGLPGAPGTTALGTTAPGSADSLDTPASVTSP